MLIFISYSNVENMSENTNTPLFINNISEQMPSFYKGKQENILKYNYNA